MPIMNGGAMGRGKEFVVGIGVSRCEEFACGVGASNPTFTIGSLSSISRAGNRLTMSLSTIEIRRMKLDTWDERDEPSVLFCVCGVVALDGIAC